MRLADSVDMMLRMIIIFALWLPFGALAQSGTVTVFAAASLRGALDEVATDYAANVALSFGGSGTMARQVGAGAPADVIILANPVWMGWLQDKRLIDGTAAVDLLSNSLVLIAPAASTATPDPDNLLAELDGARLAMGQRDAVPAGIYAREWLQSTGQWGGLIRHLAETDNVRAALALVARGETPLGIVYRTDALAEDQVRVVYAVPEELHSPITYPAAALTDSGQAFLAYLQTPEAMLVFAKHGFGQITR